MSTSLPQHPCIWQGCTCARTPYSLFLVTMMILAVLYALLRGTQVLPSSSPNVLDQLPRTVQFTGIYARDALQNAAGSNERSLWNIVWSCATVMFTCGWVAVHPNVPGAQEGVLRVVGRRLAIMAFIFVVPEFVIMWATRQYFSSRALWDKYKGIPGWTKTHAYFLIMGGFSVYQDRNFLHVLVIEELDKLHSDGRMDWTMIAESDIQDKSKGDYLSKGIVVVQATWFILQMIARGVQGLVITELEVVTLAYAILTGVLYFLWWDKPLDVRCMIPVVITPEAVKDSAGATIGEPDIESTTFDSCRNIAQSDQELMGQTNETSVSSVIFRCSDSMVASCELITNSLTAEHGQPTRPGSNLSSAKVEPNTSAIGMSEERTNMIRESVVQNSMHLEEIPDSGNRRPSTPRSPSTQIVLDIDTSPLGEDPLLYRYTVWDVERSLPASTQAIESTLPVSSRRHSTPKPPIVLSPLRRVATVSVPSIPSQSVLRHPGKHLWLTTERSLAPDGPYRFMGRTHIYHPAATRTRRPFLVRMWLSLMAPVSHMVMGLRLPEDSVRVPTFYAPTVSFLATASSYFVAYSITFVFGSVHLIAWSFRFPTVQEQWAWRIAAALIVGLPILLMPVNYLGNMIAAGNQWGRIARVVLSTPIGVLYFLARITLLILPLISLRDLPAGAYVNIVWTSFIPHI